MHMRIQERPVIIGLSLSRIKEIYKVHKACEFYVYKRKERFILYQTIFVLLVYINIFYFVPIYTTFVLHFEARLMVQFRNSAGKVGKSGDGCKREWEVRKR